MRRGVVKKRKFKRGNEKRFSGTRIGGPSKKTRWTSVRHCLRILGFETL